MDQDKKNQTGIALKNPDTMSFFEGDPDFAYVYKKTEKLASAIYLITNLFSENEPMKWALRKKASDLVSFIIPYKDTPQSGQSEFVYNLKTRALELVSLIEVASRGGLVSAMNFSILRQEFNNLVEASVVSLENARETIHTSIPPRFFETAESQPISRSPDYSSKTLAPVKDRPVLSNGSDIKKSNRQNLILSLIRKRKEVTIKDISDIIKDCSEKTIQRELNTFIAKGVLRRMGVRRWSRYSLNGDE